MTGQGTAGAGGGASGGGPGGRDRLRDKVALITGGGSGIGRAISLLFAGEGASVVVAGRRSEPLQETVREIRRRGGEATFTRGDVGRPDRVEMIVHAATYNFGGLDIVVNCAGLFAGGSILEVEERRWDRIMNANLKGPYLVSRCAVPAMRERGGGSIVNVAAAAGLTGRGGAAAFSASKGGLIALTRSMALDLAADRIRVNALCPGPVDTPMTREEGRGGPAAAPSTAGESLAMGRPGRPEDIAPLALYLASDESSWVTGSVFTVDGGLTGG